MPADSYDFLLVFSGQLDLQYNNLTGGLPAELYDLVSLRDLSLQGNTKVQGQISPLIRNWSNLVRLNLGQTKLGDTLPSEFFWLRDLEDFVVPEAKFTGEMDPDQWLNFTKLVELDLAFNNFGGPIPNIFHRFAFLGTLPSF